jgi:hypothetical protein
MKKIALIVALVCITLLGYSQKANNLIGLRGGFGTGITFQHYLDDSKAVELIAHSRWRGFSLTGLYEVHKPFFDVDGMKWYYGAGAHIGFYSYYKNGPRWYDEDWNGTRMIIGADAILGLEYFFDEIPFQVSVDWKPAINLVGYSGFWGDEGAFAIRYVF